MSFAAAELAYSYMFLNSAPRVDVMEINPISLTSHMREYTHDNACSTANTSNDVFWEQLLS